VSERIENIRRAVEQQAKCPATHIESAHVVEEIGEQTVWEGIVEVFILEKWREARVAYGWQTVIDGKTAYTVVLGIPPVETPSAAVRAAIVAATKARK
jgi:hypothetical protein